MTIKASLWKRMLSEEVAAQNEFFFSRQRICFRGTDEKIVASCLWSIARWVTKGRTSNLQPRLDENERTISLPVWEGIIRWNRKGVETRGGISWFSNVSSFVSPGTRKMIWSTKQGPCRWQLVTSNTCCNNPFGTFGIDPDDNSEYKLHKIPIVVKIGLISQEERW